MLRAGRGVTGHAYSPGPDGFCAVCQEPAAYCAGGRASDTSDSGITASVTAISARQKANSDSGDTGDTSSRPRTSWTAAELMAAEFPEPRWAVPGIVAEGVTVLAGAP